MVGVPHRATSTPEVERERAFIDLSPYRDGVITLGKFSGCSAWERHPKGDEIVQDGGRPESCSTAAPPPTESAPPPRQRQDVRGPVLELFSRLSGGWEPGQIAQKLPHLRPASIKTALHALTATAGSGIREHGGLYYWNEIPASRDTREERRAPDTPDGSALAEPSPTPEADAEAAE